MQASNLSLDLAMALDPSELARQTGLEPDSWQAQALRSDVPRILLNCSRQSGKSTIAALLAVHATIYQPNSLVLLLSPSLRQSQELFKKAHDAHAALTDPVAIEAESALRLKLTNGSRILSLPGKEHTVRGYSGVRLLIVDEAARVPDDLYFAVRPMRVLRRVNPHLYRRPSAPLAALRLLDIVHYACVAAPCQRRGLLADRGTDLRVAALAVSNGRLIGLSTPFGTRGWWYEAWKSEEPWERYEVPASQCPRISEEFLEEERRSMGEWWFAQEYECRFLDSETQPFGREDVDRAFTEEVEPWDL